MLMKADDSEWGEFIIRNLLKSSERRNKLLVLYFREGRKEVTKF